MGYTRYDYKRKKNGNLIGWLFLIIIISCFIGMGIYNIFILKGYDKDGSAQNSQDSTSVINNENVNCEFNIIQCGLYSSSEGAQTFKQKIPNSAPVFIAEDSGKFKILTGIFNSQDGDKKVEELNNSGIENYKIKIKISKNNSDIEFELIDGYIKVINKLYEKDVQSINTSDFKKWAQDILSKINNNDEEIKSISDNINNLPEEYKKENVNDSVLFLYNILIKYREN